MKVSTIARVALGGIVAVEGAAALARFNDRKRFFAAAAQRAQQLGRTLVVIGDPDAGMHTRMLRAYGCGDVCVDLVGCGACPDSVAADITHGPVERIPANSAVVFVSCVLEYVSDPQAAWTEILRMAGSPDNVWIVPVAPWTLTATLYPVAPARWRVLEAPPTAQTLRVSPVTTGQRVVAGIGLAALVIAAVSSK